MVSLQLGPCQLGVLMIETRNIETAPGMIFDVSVGGPEAGPLVLMLHGFCVSRHFWDNQIPALAAAGYFVLAPNQRGYAAGARPDPAVFDNYLIDKLIGDALDILWATGHGERGFISSGTIGAAACLGSSPKLAGEGGLADDAVAPTSSRLRSSNEDRPRAAAPLAASPRAPRFWCRTAAARGERQMGARPAGAKRRACGGDRQAPLGDRQRVGDGGGARLVPSSRPATSGRADQGADPIHLGRFR